MKESYGTLSETIHGLKKEGHSLDFNIRQEFVVCDKPNMTLSPDEFEIDKVYRFEGESNPDDQSILYAISSPKFNVKGVLVNGYGISSDEKSDALIAKLRTHPGNPLKKETPENIKVENKANEATALRPEGGRLLDAPLVEMDLNNFIVQIKDEITLAVYPPTGRVRIAAPLNVNEDTIRLFAISKLGWIKRNQQKFEEQDRLSEREYKNRESHYHLGRRYLLNIIEADTVPKVRIRNKTFIDLYIRQGTSIAKRQETMNEWHRIQLKKQIQPIIDMWQKKMGVFVQDWKVKQMKTKWGSCNIEASRIWLNLELAKKPILCIEYIIVHEMVHLLERHHNDKFIAHMDKFLPNWRQLKKELNRLPVSHNKWEY
ncbi:MAG: SprT family zinc-dependent metalloprotease [Ginsengibacter sp.]